ncbi:uncharacterized protein KRP23_4450 [Phytophthora ramorum]|uniref:uncharacterized protein n=1 Tax=Phytophthora ramorum TaxID=164328 RepID=UPI0030B60F8F|nr:hypothetical protein KRP23_4450 [Phytophthora ramorum]
MDQASSETHKAPSPETPPMKFSFRTEVRVPLLFLVTVGCILATSIYVNTRLASSAVIGRSNSLGASGYNNAQLDWKMDTAAFENTAAMPAHPTSPYYRLPTHMTPRQQRRAVDMTAHQGEKFNTECLVGMGATPLPDYFSQNLLRRRLHFLGIAMGVLGSVQNCETYE